MNKQKISKIITEEIHSHSIGELLLSGQLNESVSFNDLKNLVSKVTDKRKFIKKVIDKFNSINNLTFKKYLAHLLLITILTITPTLNKSLVNSENLANKIAKEETITLDMVRNKIEKNAKYGDPTKMTTSEEGKNLIKDHEKLRLQAYEIGDGMITIGWGHAEPKDVSNYQVGDTITREEADRLFHMDLKEKEEGVKRMFNDWKSRGNDVQITQSMFDALVSMAYNMGVSGLRNTEFADKLEVADTPEKVADLIKTTRIKKGFSGLVDRREDEYNLFVKDTLSTDTENV